LAFPAEALPERARAKDTQSGDSPRRLAVAPLRAGLFEFDA